MRIETRYLKPTDRLGSRITARVYFDSDTKPTTFATIGYDYSLSVSDAHAKSASKAWQAFASDRKLCDDKSLPWAMASIDRGFVFVRVNPYNQHDLWKERS